MRDFQNNVSKCLPQKYTSTQIHHTTQIHHKTQIQLGSNHRKKLRYKKFLKNQVQRQGVILHARRNFLQQFKPSCICVLWCICILVYFCIFVSDTQKHCFESPASLSFKNQVQGQSVILHARRNFLRQIDPSCIWVLWCICVVWCICILVYLCILVSDTQKHCFESLASLFF